MRPSAAYLVIPFLASPAFADSKSGGGGGRALSQVSAGIGTASGSTSYARGTAGPDPWFEPDAECVNLEHDPIECSATLRVRHGRRVKAPAATAISTLSMYAGAQKVHDSDGSVSLDIIVRDRRFQLAGSFSHYFEGLMSGDRLTMSMPSIAAGVRIDDLGPTRVVLEFGAVHTATKGDPMGNSSITGSLAGVRFEHTMQRDMAVLFSAHGMWFPDDIKAKSLRVGMRYGHVQASFRMLDFNVGPALYGPEVGLAF